MLTALFGAYAASTSRCVSSQQVFRHATLRKRIPEYSFFFFCIFVTLSSLHIVIVFTIRPRQHYQIQMAVWKVMVFISKVFVAKEFGGTLLSRMDLTRTHFSSIDRSLTLTLQQPGRLELGHPKHLIFFPQPYQGCSCWFVSGHCPAR